MSSKLGRSLLIISTQSGNKSAKCSTKPTISLLISNSPSSTWLSIPSIGHAVSDKNSTFAKRPLPFNVWKARLTSFSASSSFKSAFQRAMSASSSTLISLASSVNISSISASSSSTTSSSSLTTGFSSSLGSSTMLLTAWWLCIESIRLTKNSPALSANNIATFATDVSFATSSNKYSADDTTSAIQETSFSSTW